MKISYVGAKPMVSQHGVDFDQSKPDRYTFIEPALLILKQIEDKNESVITLNTDIHFKNAQIEELVHKYCKDIDKLAQERENHTKKLISDLEESVKNNSNLIEDEKRAWLGNIKIMTNYYLQYITNELVYKCLLEQLADILTHSHIDRIEFSAVNNIGLTFSHLIMLLRDHKPPLDATLNFENRDGDIVGIFNANRKAIKNNIGL